MALGKLDKFNLCSCNTVRLIMDIFLMQQNPRYPHYPQCNLTTYSLIRDSCAWHVKYTLALPKTCNQTLTFIWFPFKI